jgi:hypothetical protein
MIIHKKNHANFSKNSNYLNYFELILIIIDHFNSFKDFFTKNVFLNSFT